MKLTKCIINNWYTCLKLNVCFTVIIIHCMYTFYKPITCHEDLIPLFFRNVGEAIVGKGLAKVIRYRQDDDQRSSHYDELLAAEARAEKKLVGLHSKKEPPIHRVADVSGVSITEILFIYYSYLIYRLSL